MNQNPSKPTLYAQGDILIEKVADITSVPGKLLPKAADGVVVLAHGERSGHRHVIRDGAVMFHDELLTRGVPRELYVGHVIVTGETATVSHEEHAGIVLPRGTYRVRRQRQYSAAQQRRARLVAD